LKGFKDGTFNVLVATDVAGRGIDIPDVGHVVNFAMPADISQYTHRIGNQLPLVVPLLFPCCSLVVPLLFPCCSLVVPLLFPELGCDNILGRTGRAGKKGTATTFLTTDDAGVFYDLRMFLTNSNQAVPAELARHEAAREKVRPHCKFWAHLFAIQIRRFDDIRPIPC
jgi:ATP-dependent RNA helicase DDX23/PRP28